MTTHVTRTRRLGLGAAGLTAAAGLTEVIVGSNSWTGDKSEPTTLGILTILLAGIMAAAAVMSDRTRTSGSTLVSAAAITVPALIALTTAGRFVIPGALVGLIAGALTVGEANQQGSLRHAIGHVWLNALVAVLAAIYLAFGAVAGPVGILGVAGAAAAVVAPALQHRSKPLASGLLVVGVIPFAVVAWWSVVIPLTAVLLLAIELPQLLTSRPLARAPQH